MVHDTYVYWHPYRYFPYEKKLALRELAELLKPLEVRPEKTGYMVRSRQSNTDFDRLVYFGKYTRGKRTGVTLQSKLEGRDASTPPGERRKQSTRYSAHGLHEYKGKFNPQIVRGILNILGVDKRSVVLDPFCGSGTSLVECAYADMGAVGCDTNPLAVFVSNAKLQALSTPATELRDALELSLAYQAAANTDEVEEFLPERSGYLSQWFAPEILDSLERLKTSIVTVAGPNSKVLLALASDLLRDYSQQEPADLRIRRRRTAQPTEAFVEAFETKVRRFLDNLESSQRITGLTGTDSHAYQCDNRALDQAATEWQRTPLYDAAITSPPYATALPYIDTQRLSLVWLGLTQRKELKPLEASLTGSREFLLQREKVFWEERLENNLDALPEEVHAYCIELHSALSSTDGFRRQAVPSLLYRYLANMDKAFRSVLQTLHLGAPYALVVGHNRTTLGGTTFDIDTPRLLSSIARNCGWIHEETIPLETYQRYSIHRSNAVKSETLLILRK